jgi:predicted nucleic acid-binding protein
MKCIIDSCIFIENFKGKEGVKILFLKTVENFDCFITETIFSEVFYKVLGLIGGKSPQVLKEKKEISKILNKEEIKLYIKLLTSFPVFGTNFSILNSAHNLVKVHNLLPNDALILATCKHYGIKYLISIDKEDFTIPCEKEGIVLIDSVEKLKEVLNK